MLVKEASRGVTPVLTNAFWIPRSTITFDDKISSAREQEGLGKIADSDSNFVTQVQGEGEIEIMLDDKSLGIILTSLFGASPVMSGGNPYTATYTLSQSNQHQSLGILYQDPDISKMFTLGVVDSVTMTIDQNSIVMWKIGFKSRVGRDFTAQTPNFTALGTKFLHQHLIFKTATNVASLGAATAISLKKLELKISANTKFDTVLGTVEPEDILGQQFSVDGTLELNKEDETYRRYMLDGTYKAMEIALQRSSVNSKLDLVFPRVDFTQWEQDRKLDSIVSQKVIIKGNYDAANALDIISTCTLLNTYIGTGY